jgi:NTP pyrophosphatase (non-canonical NTP hydrolase)
LSRTYGDQSFKGDEADRCDLSDEMADVLFVLICLANQTGVDLTKAFVQNLAKKTRRDRLRHQANPKLKYQTPDLTGESDQ